MEVYEESIRQGLIVIAVWFQLMLVRRLMQQADKCIW